MNHESRPAKAARGKDQIGWENDQVHLTAASQAPSSNNNNRERKATPATARWMAAGAALTNLEAALLYADDRRPVFPCNEHPGGHSKAPLTKRGHLDATTDQEKIRHWWTKRPKALIGSPIDPEMICVDIDPRNGVTRAMFEDKVGQLTPTMTVTSGRGDGGEHLYYWRNVSALSIPFDVANPNLDELVREWANPTFHMGKHNKAFPAGVDIKINGYMIMPPSTHPDTGQPYTWNDEFVHLMPQGLWDWLQPPKGSTRTHPTGTGHGPSVPNVHALEGILRRVANEANTRNKLLFWAANRLVENGYPETAFDALEEAAAYAGLPPSEIAKTINSARKSAA